MTPVSSESFGIMRCQGSRTSCQTKSVEARRRPRFFVRTKILTQTTILVASVLLLTNSMGAKGASFSSSASSPSYAPSSFAANDRASKTEYFLSPSSSPTLPPNSNLKKTKKHKKEKQGNKISPRPKSGIENGSNPRAHHPKAQKSRGRRSASSAAFGLHERNTSHRPRKNGQNPRNRPSSNAQTSKHTAFVRDKPMRKRRASHLNNVSASTTDTYGKQKKTKTKRSKIGHATKSNKANLVDRPVAGDISLKNHKTNGNSLHTKKAKSHKKHRHKTKKSNVDSEAGVVTEATKIPEKIRELAESTLASESHKNHPRDKAPKRKRSKKKISTLSRTEIIMNDDTVQTSMKPTEDSKPKKKTKRRKRTSQPNETKSISSINGKKLTSIPPTVEDAQEGDGEEESIKPKTTDTSLNESLSEITPSDGTSSQVSIDKIAAKETTDETPTETLDNNTSPADVGDCEAIDDSQQTNEECEASLNETEIDRSECIDTTAEVIKEDDAKESELSDLDSREEPEIVTEIDEGMSVKNEIEDVIHKEEEDATIEENAVAGEEKLHKSDENAHNEIAPSKQITIDEQSADAADDSEKESKMLKSSNEDEIASDSGPDTKRLKMGQEEAATDVISTQSLQIDVESVDGEYISDANNGVGEGEIMTEQAKGKFDLSDEKDAEVKAFAGESSEEPDVVELPDHVDTEIVTDESFEEAKNINETQIAEENHPNVEPKEMNGDLERQAMAESEGVEVPETDDKSDESKSDTYREVSGNIPLVEEISSSESSDFDPEQDLVSFIEQVLHENVRSWIEESDSPVQNIVNKTRGGHSDSAINAGDVEVQQDTEVNIGDEAIEASDMIGNTHDNIAQDSNETAQELKQEAKIYDRDALEKLMDKESDAVVSIVTWNLAEDSPLEEDTAFIRKFRKNGVLPNEGSDLVLISGQECENIKPRRSEGRRSREYRRLMIKMLGKEYVPLALHLLGGIQFGLFAKRSFLKEVQDVTVADVTCGIGNVLHNKGAIAAFVKVKARNKIKGDNRKREKSLKMVFIAAHLAAHVKNSDARDSDFWRISSELEAQAPEGFLPRKRSNKEINSSFLFDSVDRVFFCGDLNYRLDLPRELTELSILHGADQDNASMKDLLRHDQLIHSMAEGRAFLRFGEGKITFMPTFKYDKESSSYDTSHKQRIPAWTDRILFQPTDGIRVLDYQSVPDAQSSDHRPVYGSYRISMEGRVLPPSQRKRKRKRPDESNY